MILYEYRVRDEFTRTKAYAENLRSKFRAESPAEELLQDAENLNALCRRLEEVLPHEIRGCTNLRRHLGWMQTRLGEGHPKLCQGDIEDICQHDLPALEERFRDWCASNVHCDGELADAVSELVVRGECDSAVRKAFVVLKSRLVHTFGLPDDLDGTGLVNAVFGQKGVLASSTDPGELQALRDLSAGLYGVFRNRYSHHDVAIPWHEADAVLSMINYLLKWTDEHHASPL